MKYELLFNQLSERMIDVFKHHLKNKYLDIKYNKIISTTVVKLSSSSIPRSTLYNILSEHCVGDASTLDEIDVMNKKAIEDQKIFLHVVENKYGYYTLSEYGKLIHNFITHHDVVNNPFFEYIISIRNGDTRSMCISIYDHIISGENTYTTKNALVNVHSQFTTSSSKKWIMEQCDHDFLHGAGIYEGNDDFEIDECIIKFIVQLRKLRKWMYEKEENVSSHIKLHEFVNNTPEIKSMYILHDGFEVFRTDTKSFPYSYEDCNVHGVFETLINTQLLFGLNHDEYGELRYILLKYDKHIFLGCKFSSITFFGEICIDGTIDDVFDGFENHTDIVYVSTDGYQLRKHQLNHLQNIDEHDEYHNIQWNSIFSSYSDRTLWELFDDLSPSHEFERNFISEPIEYLMIAQFTNGCRVVYRDDVINSLQKRDLSINSNFKKDYAVIENCILDTSHFNRNTAKNYDSFAVSVETLITQIKNVLF